MNISLFSTSNIDTTQKSMQRLFSKALMKLDLEKFNLADTYFFLHFSFFLSFIFFIAMGGSRKVIVEFVLYNFMFLDKNLVWR
jgi:hypothetical protein